MAGRLSVMTQLAFFHSKNATDFPIALTSLMKKLVKKNLLPHVDHVAKQNS